MPTKRQLYKNWESTIGFFGGSGQPQQSFDNTDGHGLTTEMFIDKPLIEKGSYDITKGEIVGRIILNSESKEVKIIPNTQISE